MKKKMDEKKHQQGGGVSGPGRKHGAMLPGMPMMPPGSGAGKKSSSQRGGKKCR